MPAAVRVAPRGASRRRSALSSARRGPPSGDRGTRRRRATSGPSWAAHSRCARKISGLSWSRIAASTGRSRKSSGWRQKNWSSASSPATYTARPRPRRPGAAPHLAQRGDGAGERDDDRRVELADVDAELQRVGRDDRAQLAARQPPLELAALLGGVAGAVGHDELGELGVGVACEVLLDQAAQQLDALARLHEADRRARPRARAAPAARRPRRAPSGACRAPRRSAAGSTSRSAARGAGEPSSSISATSSRPVSRSASSTGLAIVAEVSRKRGSVPYAAAIRRRRRSTLATCEPNTPR